MRLCRLVGASARPFNFSVREVVMQRSGFAAERRLRTYRLLANSLPPLLAIALLVLVLRWTVPELLSLLEVVWTADAVLILVLVVPWLVVSWAFALGKVKCPSCGAPFVSSFHLWVPKTCQNCRHDITPPKNGASSNNR